MRSNVFLRKYKTSEGEIRFILIVREYGRKDRYIHLGAISRRLAEDRKQLSSRESHQREYVFCHPDGRKVASFKRSIGSALKKHGITGVTPHGLRKTFCSQLARYKVHPKVAQQLMGHADVNLTMRVYTEIDDDQMREAVNVLPTVNDLRRSRLKLVVGEGNPFVE